MRLLSIGLLTTALYFVTLGLLGQSPTDATLRVGDDAPALHPFNWINGDPVNAFRKGHIYVIEFGATWCSPCAAAIPELTRLAHDLGDTATVISMFVMEDFSDGNLQNPAYVARVKGYVKKRGDAIGYVVGVDGPKRETEIAWLRAAGREGIPHIFVVDRDGKIAWIGGHVSELRKVLRDIIKLTHARLKVAAERPPSSGTRFEQIKAIVDSANDDAFFLSVMTKFQEGEDERTGIENRYFIDNYYWARNSPGLAQRRDKVQAVGESLRRLYYMAYADTLWNYPPMMNPSTGEYPDTLRWPHHKRAYGRYWNGLLLEVKDSSLFDANFKTGRNRFNYLLKVPRGMGSSAFMQKRMQDDLEACFGYAVTVESRMMPYWRLTTSKKGTRALRSKQAGGKYRMYVDEKVNVRFENADVRDLIFQLEIRYGSGPYGDLVYRPELQPPFVDETGINTKIDYIFPAEFHLAMTKYREEGKPYPFKYYRQMLRTMGFELVKGYKRMKVVVVRDVETAAQNNGQ